MLTPTAHQLFDSLPGVTVFFPPDGEPVTNLCAAQEMVAFPCFAEAVRCRRLPEGSGEHTVSVGERWLKVRAVSYLGGVLCTAEDVTEMIALQRRDVFARVTADLARVGGWELDLETMVPSWSDEVCRIHDVPSGYVPSLEEAIHFYAPEARPVINAAVEKGVETGEGWDLELQLITAIGRRIWVRAIGVPVMEGGRCVRLLGTFQDITAEHDRKVQLERLAMAVQRTDNGVVTTDLSGRVDWVNAGFTRITGVSLDEIRGRTLAHLLREPGGCAETVSRFRDRLARGEGFCEELRNHRKDGSPYWASVEVLPLHDGRGELTGYMAIEVDITAKKEAESALIAARDEAQHLAEQAQAAAQAKSEFLATMSHELRTPLNGILGTAQLLDCTALTPLQRQYVDTVQTSGRGLLAILNDVLDLSKIESGHLDLRPAPFSLRDTLGEVITLLRPAAQHLSLTASWDPNLPAVLSGDALRVRQVLINLVGNAIKFTERGQVSVQALPHGPHNVKLIVQDTGVGISKRDQEQLFSAFTQVDSSARRRFGGTGLGLAICQRLVEMMGGEIGVHSVEGRGSTFWFTLPFPRAARTTAPAVPTPAAAFPGLPVLLVEDNRINQLVATRMLEQLGCEVTLAEDGLAALEQWEADQFALVVMDCHMPRMDGWEATAQIRSREQARALRQTPIVALTASVMPDDIQRCTAVGMDDYLSKPLDREALCAVLRRITRTQQAI